MLERGFQVASDVEGAVIGGQRRRKKEQFDQSSVTYGYIFKRFILLKGQGNREIYTSNGAKANAE